MKFKWKFWEKDPEELKKIYKIKGELTPGVLTVIMGTYDENGDPLPQASEVVEIKVKPKIRKVVNRILADVETESDLEILELIANKLIS